MIVKEVGADLFVTLPVQSSSMRLLDTVPPSCLSGRSIVGSRSGATLMKQILSALGWLQPQCSRSMRTYHNPSRLAVQKVCKTILTGGNKPSWEALRESEAGPTMILNWGSYCIQRSGGGGALSLKRLRATSIRPGVMYCLLEL